jgi:hypothetical protein
VKRQGGGHSGRPPKRTGATKATRSTATGKTAASKPEPTAAPAKAPAAKPTPGPHAETRPGSPSLNAARRAHADAQEVRVAQAVGGKRLDDYEPHDVAAPKSGVQGDHAIEVKSLIYGGKPDISVHDNALVRKIEDAKANPGRTYHTVVIDGRATSEGGVHADKFSGHEIYYKRASGRYAIEKMHKVKDIHELNTLMNTPNGKLPAAARGEFPKGQKLAELRDRAAKEKAYNDARSKERKARLGPAAYGKGSDQSVSRVAKRTEPKTSENPQGDTKAARAAGEVSHHYETATAAAHSVHGDLGLPAIEVRALNARSKDHGAYVHNGYEAKAIEIHPETRHPAFAAIHEHGHFVDHQGLGTKGFGFASEEGGAPRIMKAIHESKETKELVRSAKSFKGPAGAHAKYLAEPKEIFARAYSQWVATKSNNEHLMSGLNSDRGGNFGKMAHWSDESFAPISKEFDAHFAARKP